MACDLLCSGFENSRKQKLFEKFLTDFLLLRKQNSWGPFELLSGYRQTKIEKFGSVILLCVPL